MRQGPALASLVYLRVSQINGCAFCSVTNVAQTNAPDQDYQQVLAVLGEQELADLTVAVAPMNAYNRFGVSMRMVPAALTQ